MLNSRFIDVDFAKDPKYTRGCLGMFRGLKRYARYEDKAHVYPESDYQELADEMARNKSGLEWLITRIMNQLREGSCVGNGACQGVEIKQAEQFGLANVVPVSAMSLYKRIGRSAQSGAVVIDALDELEARGALPLDTPENREKFADKVMPNTGFREPYPADWENTASYFRALEWLEVRGLAELVSSLLQRFPVVVGRQGHSICYCDYLPDGNVKYANSWGDWGEAGYGYDTPRQVKMTLGQGVGSWALRSVTTPNFQGEA